MENVSLGPTFMVLEKPCVRAYHNEIYCLLSLLFHLSSGHYRATISFTLEMYMSPHEGCVLEFHIDWR